MKKKIVIPTIALGVISLAGVYGINSANADENDNFNIISKIAEKFNLQEAEVETVFNEHRDEMRVERMETFGNHLDQMVSEGKITEDQKQSILDKKQELQESREQLREELRDLSSEERREKMREHKGEMKEWLEAQGIDIDHLKDGEGFGGKGKRGGHFGPRF